MTDRTEWLIGPPDAPGTYLVRPSRSAFLDGTGIHVERVPVRVVKIETGDERFDGGDIAGTLDAECWEWSGPISIPLGL